MPSSIALIVLAATAEAQVAKLGYQKASPYAFASSQLNNRGFTQRLPTSPASQGRLSSVMAATEKEEARAWIEDWKAKQGSQGGLAVVGAAPTLPPVEESDPKTNVYGGETASCGSFGACTWTETNPEVCVSNVPYNSEIFWDGMPGMTGGDSISRKGGNAGKFVGNTDAAGEWKKTAICMSVWEFQSPSMIFGQYSQGSFLFPRVDAATWAQSFWKRLKYGFVDDIAVCEAVPANVLDSAYSVEMFNDCTSLRKIRPYGPGGGKVETVEKGKCKRFRSAVEKVCNLCAGQAPGDKEKSNLASKCAALGVTGAAGLAPESSGAGYAILFSSVSFMLVLVGVGKVYRGFRKPAFGLQQPILEA